MSVTLESKVLNGQLITPANGAPASGDYVAMQPASGSGTFLSVLSDSCKCVFTVVAIQSDDINNNRSSCILINP